MNSGLISICCRGYLAWTLLCVISVPATGQDAEGKAPPNHVILKRTLGGAYFVSQPLKEEYDGLLSQTRLLKNKIDAGELGGDEARRQLLQLRIKLEGLREQIEQKKVLVSPVQTFETSETVLFDVGPERLIVVTSDQVRVRGWEGDKIKCVLKKTVLGLKREDAENQFDQIKLVDEHGIRADLVGDTPERRAASEAAFQATEAAQKMTEKQKKARGEFVAQIASSYDIFSQMQGKNLNCIRVSGLTFQEGNRQLSIRVISDGGGGSFGSSWRRHAMLTVYVPKCKQLLLRGCLVGLDVADVNGSVVATDRGSRNRNYEGVFEIRDIQGSVTVENLPIQVIEAVEKDVTVYGTVEYANSGTHHEDGFRTHYTPPAEKLFCRNIGGDFTAWFSRSDLEIENVHGSLDVRNEFGNTKATISGRLPDQAHRIVSDAGDISVVISDEALTSVPLVSLTNCGTVRTNLDQRKFENTNFTTGNSYDGTRRGWRGVRTTQPGFPANPLAAFERPARALKNLERSAGLDLISRAGVVLVAKTQ